MQENRVGKSRMKKLILLMMSSVFLVSPLDSIAGLKERIQEEVDSNPFLKEQGIKIVVQKEENGYVTLDMAAGSQEIRKALADGVDIRNISSIEINLAALSKADRETIAALQRFLGRLEKTPGVKEVVLRSRDDLAEGLHYVFEINSADLEGHPVKDAQALARSVIRKRVVAMGITTFQVQADGDNRINVKVAKTQEFDQKRTQEILKSVAFLTFHMVHAKSAEMIRQLNSRNQVPPGFSLATIEEPNKPGQTREY